MSGVNGLLCARPGCLHTFGDHARTTGDATVERGPCSLALVYDCPCTAFVWPPYEEDPDQAVNDYKDGYTDAEGNVNEPDWIEP